MSVLADLAIHSKNLSEGNNFKCVNRCLHNDVHDNFAGNTEKWQQPT